MKNIHYSLYALILGGVIAFNSCKKADVDNDTQSAVDNSICEAEFIKVMPNVNDKAIRENGVQKMQWGTCPDVYVDPADSADGFPVTMWLTYDTTTAGSGCLSLIDGKLRKGQLKCVFTKPWHNDSAGNNLVTITFYDYIVNGIEYDGTVILHKPTANSYRTQVIGGKCTKAGGWELFWDCDRTIAWVSGQGDLDETNDVFSITGTASGVNRNGVSYTTTIISPLIKASNCKWIEKGIMDITPQGRPTRTLDYGNTGCDNKATVTINGNSYNLTLN